jgi:hypothetical protein
MLSKRGQSQKATFIKSEKASWEIESILVVARRYKVGQVRSDFFGYKVSFVCDEPVLNLVMMVIQLCEYSKNHWVEHLKGWVCYYVSYIL